MSPCFSTSGAEVPLDSWALALNTATPKRSCLNDTSATELWSTSWWSSCRHLVFLPLKVVLLCIYTKPCLCPSRCNLSTSLQTQTFWQQREGNWESTFTFYAATVNDLLLIESWELKSPIMCGHNVNLLTWIHTRDLHAVYGQGWEQHFRRARA